MGREAWSPGPSPLGEARGDLSPVEGQVRGITMLPSCYLLRIKAIAPASRDLNGQLIPNCTCVAVSLVGAGFSPPCVGPAKAGPYVRQHKCNSGLGSIEVLDTLLQDPRRPGARVACGLATAAAVKLVKARFAIVRRLDGAPSFGRWAMAA